MAVHAAYPVRVGATLDPQLSRWMWLVKWFLAIPHYVVLAFLWVAFGILSLAAGVAILFTGRYPRGIFEFNAGVLRWSWRVSHYALGAMGTDRYPPFTLQEVPDYPAHFEVEYPEQLSRGLVLVKWLLAIPHFLIVGILVGGTWFAWTNEDWRGSSFGLIEILALVAVVTLAFTGSYPRALFDLILGLNRWVLRVAAYTALMTDQYPPFRLDTGDVDGAAAGALPSTGVAGVSGGWTGGRIAGLVAGVLLSFVAVGIGGAGGVGLWADQTQRDGAGFLVTSSEILKTDTHALVAEDVSIPMEGPDRLYPERILGDARVRVTPLGDGGSVFVGIAPAAAAAEYLDGVGYATAADLLDDVRVEQSGGGPASPPGEQTFWAESSSGTGPQTIEWAVAEGDWTIIAMNANGAAGVRLEADAGLEAPALTGVAVGLIAGGGILLLLAVLLIARVTSRASARG